MIGAHELEELCHLAMPDERLTHDELERVCFGAGDVVIGSADGAAAYTVKQYDQMLLGWLLLVVVRPECQGKGVGKRLVGEVLDHARARKVSRMHVANAAPRYLWPGVDVMNTRAGMLVEAAGFSRDDVAINMSIPTSVVPPTPPGLTVERETTNGALSFAARSFPHWVDELAMAQQRGTAFVARNEFGATLGFGCHSCNRAGWIGPMATDPEVQQTGVGSAVLGALCADLAARGHRAADISWVSNLRFYGKCGATVSRVFTTGHLRL